MISIAGIVAILVIVVIIIIVARAAMSSKDEAEPTEDEKQRIAEYEKAVQVEYQEKEKLIEEIKGLSDEDLNSYQRFFEYVQSGL